jgi:hypothetical protein
MALEGFRPTIWSKNFITNIEKALVYKNVVNTDYEGDIAGGARSVKINELGAVNINDYTEDTDITVQVLTDAQKELVIDQKKYFAFNIDDVLAAQSNVTLMERAMQMAAFNMADTVDQYIASLYLGAGIDTTNLGTNTTDLDIYAAGAGTYDHPLGVFTNATRYMDEANVPTSGRWVVVPPWLHQYIKQAQIIDNISGGIKGGVTGAYGNGYIGSVLGFECYASNNVSKGAAWINSRVMFGSRDAISFAGQITKIQTAEVEKQFGTMVKGLYVYGAKVVRPDHLLTAYLAPAGLSS